MDRLTRKAFPCRLAALATAAVVALMLASCAGTTRTDRQYESYKVVADATLGSDDIVVVRADWEREMGRVRATVRVRHVGEIVRVLHYRFGWLDQAGRPVGGDEGVWQNVEVEPGKVVLLDGYTSAKDVTDFVLQIDPGK